VTSVTTRIDRARWWALTNQPFYGSLAMRLPDKLDPSTETAHTNGREIAWNPTFVESLSDEELRFVLLHETLHCAHQHMWRLPADQRGNVAGDHEINLTLQDIADIKMPDGGLADSQYRGLACEEILGRLPEPDQQDGGGKGGESQGGASDPCGTFGEPAADPSGDAQAAAQASQELRDAWDGAVIQAAQAAQALGVGDVPGDLQRILDRIRHQSIDWRREMADFVKDAMSTRNDWSRSARRHAWQPVIYPRKRADEIGKVVFARDTSGSVSNQQLSAYSALITECLSETGCSGLVLDADAAIKDEIELAPGDECPLSAKGGGGTDFRPVFNRVDELVAMGEHIAGVVYITDLCGRAPDTSEIPTLWLATTSMTGPFGRTVHVEA
jgi:predicted metal-dependent peptidase